MKQMNQTNWLPTDQHIETALSTWTHYLCSLAERGFAATGKRGLVFLIVEADQNMALKVAGSGYFIPSDKPDFTESLRVECGFPDEQLRRYDPAFQAVVGFYMDMGPDEDFFRVYTLSDKGKLQ